MQLASHTHTHTRGSKRGLVAHLSDVLTTTLYALVMLRARPASIGDLRADLAPREFGLSVLRCGASNRELSDF